MLERFVFSNDITLDQIEQIATSQQGQEAFAQIKSEFTSLADVLHHVGRLGSDSSVLHFPSGGGIALIGVSKAEINHFVTDHAAALKPFL